jgi:hypothetical protein
VLARIGDVDTARRDPDGGAGLDTTADKTLVVATLCEIRPRVSCRSQGSGVGCSVDPER